MWPFARKQKARPRRLRELQEQFLEERVRELRARRGYIYGSYDAAQSTERDAAHWAWADLLSADAANSKSVRETLRKRARYEVANNSYAKGIVLTLANYCVGTGPRLQMLTEDERTNREVEELFGEWAQEVGLAEKLLLMRMARTTDGEAFALLRDNKTLTHDIKLDVQLIEADQVTTPHVVLDQPVDGIVLDEYDQPKTYHILSKHPGGSEGLELKKNDVDARQVIHWFRADRPGQHRGIPEITPALPLFAQLRRYTLAVIEAAETAADLAGVLHTEAPADEQEYAPQPLDTIEIQRGMLMTLPDGWDMRQMQAQQPTTSYKEFKREILTEIARCLNMPYNIAACDSSTYNYASGRLDHQTFFRSIRIDQAFMARAVLDRILNQWLTELASLSSGLASLSSGLALMLSGRRLPRHQWFWDGMEHVDPVKEAKAQEMRLKNHTTTLAHEYAREGKDWEAELRQRAREVKLQKELDLPLPQAAPAVGAAAEDEIEEALENALA